MTGKYAEVIISAKSREVDRVFYYAVPEWAGCVSEGSRVTVPFGKGNTPREGFITGFSDAVPIEPEKIKKILKFPDGYPSLDKRMLGLIRWMKDKYFATASGCIKCLVPAAVKNRAAPRVYKRKDAPVPDLSDEQSYALTFIKSKFINNDYKPTLIQGVTGSGKTEIYLRLIDVMLSHGRQVIVLVPEISLTPQMIDIFTARFGELVAVTHSRLSAGSRYESWNKARTGAVSVMIGTRSAVFAPFPDPGLIIIDEEHDHSYKSDQSPKYSAKEIAGYFNRENGVHLVAGSATPSLESYYEALNGRTDLVTLKERINKRMPEVFTADMRRELDEGNLSVFSSALKDALKSNLSERKQSILFLNRRGHSTFVSCRKCGFVLKCGDCSVNFTYHRYNEHLMCHYCGKRAKSPDNCPVCGSKYIKFFGVGTQKVEQELMEFLPGCKVLRMDYDTTQQKNSHEKILSAFKNRQADVLIGTQMIAKGIDIANVTLVGVICADISLNMGDYRSGETTFQLLTQVAGRAGRSDISGKVIIQTYAPDHYAVRYAKDQDYAEFYSHEISLRRQMNYPPYSKLFLIMLSGESEKKIIVLLFKLNEIMQYINKDNAFETIGPAPAMVSKVKNSYRWQIIVKAEDEERLKRFALYSVDKLKEHEDTSGVTFSLTPNPL